jgi:hypothetical protein
MDLQVLNPGSLGFDKPQQPQILGNTPIHVPLTRSAMTAVPPESQFHNGQSRALQHSKIRWRVVPVCDGKQGWRCGGPM